MSETRMRAVGDAPPGTPLWVKVFGIIVVALVLLVGTVHLTGHGLMGHMPRAQQGIRRP